MVNWKIFSIGLAMASIGGWIHTAAKSALVSQVAPNLSGWLQAIIPFAASISMIGAFIVPFGLLPNHRKFAFVLGILFSLFIFGLAFYGS